MNIGVLFCSYNCDHSIDEVLKPWIEVKQRAHPDQFLFSFSYGQFKEYADLFGAAPIEYPEWIDRRAANIDFFQVLPPLSEAENRNAALKPLLKAGCDLIMLVDAQDEYFTVEQIDEIFDKVRLDRFVSWFSIQYRNFVFTDQEYLAEPFCPPRIFRVKTNGFTLDRFYYDNDIIMKNEEKEISYKDLPNKLIRNNFVKHLSWMSDQVGKMKTEYQKKRWGEDGCGFSWNEAENKLEFNKGYYKKHNQPIPRTMKISIDSTAEKK